MYMTPRISLCIVSKNEEQKIAKCILSAKGLVNEIIVVDSYSKDKTAQIAAELGAVVYEHPFTGFVDQKNYALSKVTSEWVIFLDADEILPQKLVDEIRQAISCNEYVGYTIPRVKAFLGKNMKHGGTRTEYILRLFKSESGSFFEGQFNEKVQVVGKVGALKNYFVQHPYTTLDNYLEKFNKYSSISAKALYKKGIKFSMLRTMFSVPYEFIKRYFIQLGFLDGFRGLIWAFFSMAFIFARSVKLWNLCRQNGHK